MFQKTTYAVMLALLGLPIAAQADLVIIHHSYSNGYVVPYGEHLLESRPLHLISSSPGDYARVSEAPETIKLHFNRPIEAQGSFIRVYNLYGAQVNEESVAADERTLSTTIPSDLPKGRYSVKWSARCQCDADDAYDRFAFTVR